MAEKKKVSSSSIEQYANKDDEISQPLTKNAHRNPDIHQRGDTLPESLLEYQEGSATLFPDIAGNTPQMLRNVQTVFGNNVVQGLVVAAVQLANLSTIVVCPPQAAGSPKVFVNYSVAFDALVGAGVTDNWATAEMYVNGIVNTNSKVQYSPGSKDGIGRIVLNRARIPLAINPGQTLTLDIRVYVATVTTPLNSYQSHAAPHMAMLSAELYY